MRAREIQEGIMNNVGYAAGQGVGHGVNAAGSVAKGAVRTVKNVGKAAGKLAGGALDALSGKYQDGTGSNIVKTATGTLMPKIGDQVYSSAGGIKRIWSVTGTDEEHLQVELQPVRRIGQSGQSIKPVIIPLKQYDTLTKVEQKPQ